MDQQVPLFSPATANTIKTRIQKVLELACESSIATVILGAIGVSPPTDIPMTMLKVMFTGPNADGNEINPVAIRNLLVLRGFLTTSPTRQYVRCSAMTQDIVRIHNMKCGLLPSFVKFLINNFPKVLCETRNHHDYGLIRVHALYFEKFFSEDPQS